VILTNAAGAVNTEYKPGDIMVIKDHINLVGASPLRGPNLNEFGKRFYDVSDMYTKNLRELAKRCAANIGQTIHEGIYYYAAGPHFETPAEIRAMRILGADAVGMSTITESLTAAHCDMKLLAFSLMTNMAAGILDQPLSGEEVSETAEKASARFAALIREVIKDINSDCN
jgi:purine-nucleoside phosphorylase